MAFTSFISTLDTALKVALYERFVDIFDFDSTNKGVVQFPREVAYRMIAEKKDDLSLDFISMYRTGTKFSWERQRTPLARRGMMMYSEVPGVPTIGNVKASPIDLSYEVTFWSKDLDKINQALESYFFWQQDNPTLTILYNDLWNIEPKLHVTGEATDHSTVPEMLNKGIIYAYSCQMMMEGWALQSEVLPTIMKIQVTYRDGTNITEAQEDTVITEGSTYDAELDSLIRFFRENLYSINDVDVENRYFFVKDGVEDDFTVGQKIYVGGSTGNDNAYTVATIINQSDCTILQVTEDIVDSTVDGTISFTKNQE